MPKSTQANQGGNKSGSTLKSDKSGKVSIFKQTEKPA